MSKAGRKVVGIFAAFFGIFNLILAGVYTFYLQMIQGFINPILRMLPINAEQIFNYVVGGVLPIIGLVVIGIIWLLIAYGLFTDQEWAALLAKILAILYLIGSIFTCNCIGIVLAIIVLYLLKSENVTEKHIIYKQPIDKEPDRRCTNCGRSIPFDSLGCPYCGKQFEDFYDKQLKEKTPDKQKQKETSEKKSSKEIKEEKKPSSEEKLQFCDNCGKKIEGSPKFCSECGTKL
jgi:hypothetical protein